MVYSGGGSGGVAVSAIPGEVWLALGAIVVLAAVCVGLAWIDDKGREET